ncbi:MAG TPA: gluconate 2-dehydrogenase subunit 3 family protein [Bryobacteraceae bacterium]
MASYSSDRRSVLKILGSIGATCAYPFAGDELFGQNSPAHHHAVSMPMETEPRFFNGDDFSMISRIADLIIPETDTPGASGAGVPAYIDLVISRNGEHQRVAADGLRWLDAEAKRIADKKFIDLTEQQQLPILEALCESADNTEGAARGRNVQFFALMKALTADGYYTSQIGLIEELGYKGNTVRSSYPPCVPEH